jgi:O-antigen/teichoic acid export membrane protein
MCGFGRPSFRLIRRTIGFGMKIYPATVMNFANYRLDGWLLGVLANQRELGLYSIGVAWAEALFFLPTAVGYAQRPNLVRGTSDDANVRAASGFRIAVLLTIPLALGMVVLAPFLCITVFGARFHGSIIDLRILVLGAFGITALKLLGNALTARGMPLRQTAATGVAFLCTIVFDAVLIPLYGGVGASIASTVAYTAGGVAIVAIFMRTMRVPLHALVPTLSDVRLLLRQAQRAAGGAPAGAAVD